ncbi:putative sulfate exporter family transporter [Enterococcus durans]|uniref:YeiH family protein n=1 Tax=Enterococcus durans TaxID=53345 RepID=UPI0011BE4AB3|nr:putative sulfate exporter family transporter [Enterococcus durans]QED59892.1 putative sulfate exporter family transporter [Enterococcus durans]QED62380.1 putative sulfate exporter family transporter [Enterococcus durans]
MNVHSPINRFKELDIQKILPGLLLALLVAIASKLLAVLVPQLGAATVAILLGILLGNTFFKQTSLATGTKFAESKLLECSVFLLGATVTAQTIAQIGIKGILFVLLQMSVTIVGAYWIGKKLRFSDTSSLMMAGGNAVCGSSAIASIAPVIHAEEEEEKGQIITLVNLLGTVMMLTLPFLGLHLFGDNLIEKSALLGGTLQSVGQVVAGASLLDSSVVQFAMLFKILRIMMLVVVVYLFEKFMQKKIVATTHAPHTKQTKRKLPLPWYVLGFVIFSLINSLFTLPAFIDHTAHFISNWFEITALAAIGLRLDFAKFMKEGPRFLSYGLSVGLLQTIMALFFIWLTQL